ncbi:hypothetical protein ABIF38_008194 [Bradyrhizobium japonicum]|jgi:hypothetical protein|uniref:Uncharacterized protein n=1 Tax=Bradyrhizobium elkanii TaxID=29448 RepID=A0A8I2CA25_BRAEL|nr:hypothetical protein [Bradyrhizobium elkanii]MCS4006727.1 hypothetical protein [Bradyrhizobium elkanii USDA 61]MBP2428289.1 hypothetical protein [Bradyrhizobium elkanii]MCP1729490.1 hypothetical protein [Bradyrhizobium elkanii]MCP1756226.1 hypothetical protein [Bradyrhizobium elkanii]
MQVPTIGDVFLVTMITAVVMLIEIGVFVSLGLV